MFKVKIILQGRAKEAWLKEALFEYEKRLKNKLEIEWIFAENRLDLIQKTAKEPRLIALDLKGRELDSEAVCHKLFSEWGSRTAFAIGGAEGLPPEVLAHAFFRWSLSPLTFTHQIVRLLLVEQLYRAIEIEKGSSYHK